MRRLTLLTTGLGRGGAETQVALLARTFQQRGYNVEVIVLIPKLALSEELTAVGIPVRCLDMRAGTADPRAILRLAGMLRKSRPHILHTHQVHANLLGRIVRPLASIPVLISTAHSVIEGARWREWAYRVTDPLCDLTTQVSRLGAERYSQIGAVPASKLRWIDNGLDTSAYGRAPEMRRKLRSELNLNGHFVWLAVGNLREPKDYPTMLDAMGALESHPKEHLLLVAGAAGTADYEAKLRKLAVRRGLIDRVRWLGCRADVPALMSAADGFVMSSSWEGTPMAVLEAAASELPVIATRVGGIPEAVEDGRSAYLVPPSDPRALTAAMDRMMNLSDAERLGMGRAGRERVQSTYGIESIADKWTSIHDELLSRAGKLTTPGHSGKVIPAFKSQAMKGAAGETNPTIVQVLTRLGGGGPPLQSVMLTREMTKRGYHSILVTGRLDPQDGDMSYLLCKDDLVHWIPEMSRSISPIQDLRALIALYRFLKRERPAIVHTHTAKAGALGRVAAWMAGVPVVVHTFHGNVLTHYFSKPVNWAIRHIERALSHLTHGICVLAPQQASELVDHHHIASHDKVHVVPLGMDLSAFSAVGPVPPNRAAVTVGWMGRFVPIKNIPLLIEIAEETLRRTDRVRFVIAGDGPEAPLVKALADKLGPDRFTWLGWCEDVTTVVNQCDVLIQTSRNEGTPVALIQGMAAGRPFISTPAGGVVNMVIGPMRREQDGCRWFDNGVLADADAGAFAAAICELATDPGAIARMGERAAEFACAHHSLPNMLQSLDALYSALLEQQAPAAPVSGVLKT